MGLLRRRADPVEQQQRAQQANQEHLTNLQFDDDGSMDRGYIDQVTKSELDPGTVEILSNLMSKDFVLSNFNDAEVHEHRWLSRELLLEVEAMHPDAGTMWQGRFRQVASGEERNGLRPLDDAQKTVMQQFIQGVIARGTRSKDGWQQEEVNKSYNVSERREPDADDGGFI